MKLFFAAIALLFSNQILAGGRVRINVGYGNYGAVYAPVYAAPVYAPAQVYMVQPVQPQTVYLVPATGYYAQPVISGYGVYGTTNQTLNYYGNLNSTVNYYGNTNFTNNYYGNTNGTINLNGASNLTINGNQRSNVTVNGGNVTHNR